MPVMRNVIWSFKTTYFLNRGYKFKVRINSSNNYKNIYRSNAGKGIRHKIVENFNE